MNRNFKNPKNKPQTQNSSDGFFVRPSVAEKIREEKQNQKSERRKAPADKFFVKAGKFRQQQHKEKPKTQLKDETKQPRDKKPFNKKQWRLQKYSNKYKVEEWENKRREFMTRRYNKELKSKELKRQPGFDVQKIYEEVEKQETQESAVEVAENEEEAKWKRKGKRNYANTIQKLKYDKEQAREEAEKRKEEKKAAMEAYKRKKLEKNRILGKKTSRGQPLMKGRLELLLQQIQESCPNT